jgi:hypothetical protein
MASKTKMTYPLRSQTNDSSGTLPSTFVPLNPNQQQLDQVSNPAVSSKNDSSNMDQGPIPEKRKEVTIEDESDQSPEKKFRSEMIAKLLVSLECPVCTEVPRSAPIFGCQNGHLLCAKCQPRVEACPICRSQDIKCRNGFAEKFVSCFVLTSLFNSVTLYYRISSLFIMFIVCFI